MMVIVMMAVIVVMVMAVMTVMVASVVRPCRGRGKGDSRGQNNCGEKFPNHLFLP